MWYLIVPIVTILSLWWLWKRPKSDRILQGPKGHPLIGNALQIDTKRLHFLLEKWAKKFGPVFHFSILRTNVVVLSSAELIRKAFASDKYGRVFNDRPDTFYRKHWLSHAIAFMRYDETLLKTRKAFHSALRLYGDGVVKFETTVTSEIRSLVEKIRSLDGYDVDPAAIFQRSFGNLMSILVIGEPVSDTDLKNIWDWIYVSIESLNPVDEFILFNFPFVRFFPGRYSRIYKDLLEKTEEMTSRYLRPYQETFKFGEERGLVDALIRIRKEAIDKGETWMNDNFLTGLITTTFGAGLSTTFSSMLSIFLALINHPSCERRIYEEIVAVCGKHRLPTLNDRDKMPYTEAAIMESLRLASILPLSFPHNCLEDCEFEGYKIRKDTRILANHWFVNRDPKVWGDPDVFRPGRFLDMGGNLLPPDHKLRQAWLVFGVGRRNCPGEVMARSRLFLYVTSLVQTFRFLPPTEKELVKFDPTTYTADFVPKPPTFYCKIEVRE